ncbi:MAG: amino acid deaminase/aldolase, partial [Deltaproteobacteria bacterium]|nr:amino acid deaminase/aldolase [Deltaproteobacteria bacterium]
VAYPTLQASDMALAAETARKTAFFSMVVDSRAHLEALAAAGREAGINIGVCLDIDLSYRPAGGRVHLGVRRSPIRTESEAVALAAHAAALDGVAVNAAMGYEAQIAGVGDAIPGQGGKNRILRGVKRLSVRELTRRRQAVVGRLKSKGHDIQVVNGGGSGSLVSTGADPSVTEVTAGSAFYAPGLFHHFQEVLFQPSAFFALQVVRRPAHGIVTCL